MRGVLYLEDYSRYTIIQIFLNYPLTKKEEKKNHEQIGGWGILYQN